MQRFTASARDAFSLLLDAAPDAMVVVDSQGNIAMVNRHAARLFGFDDGELVGRPVEILVPERYRASHFEHRSSFFHTPSARPMGAGLELFGLRKDGSEFPVEISLSPVQSEAGPMAISAIRDITDRKRADEERVKLAREQAARAEAEQANRLKDEFLAMLAHELRNPLAAIRTGLGVLDKAGHQDPVAAGTREVMSRQLRQLSRMVDDLLDVSRVSTGKVVLHRETADLAEVIARCVAIVAKTGAAHHEITVRTQPVLVDADPMRLEQVVTNLLTNAVKYTPSGGSITVTAGRAGDTGVITIEDTGVGMTPDLVDRVFDLFVQGERALARSEGGLGIGLTLVKRLVEMHGGSVAAESDGPGRGSRFTVRFPVATSDVPRQAPQRAAPAIVNASRLSRRVLIVEDNDDVRAMMRTLLELEGHEVHEAVDGPSGVQTAIDVRPDVAFIDIGLPGIDGYQLVDELRARSDEIVPVLVAVTGYGRIEDRERMQQAGFDAHLIKPVEPVRVQEIMARTPRR